MQTTPLGFPYPEGTDKPEGHKQIEGLAKAVDDYLQTAPTEGPTGPTGPPGPTGAVGVPNFYETSTPPLGPARGDQWIVTESLGG